MSPYKRTDSLKIKENTQSTVTKNTIAANKRAPSCNTQLKYQANQCVALFFPPPPLPPPPPLVATAQHLPSGYKQSAVLQRLITNASHHQVQECALCNSHSQKYRRLSERSLLAYPCDAKECQRSFSLTLQASYLKSCQFR